MGNDVTRRSSGRRAVARALAPLSAGLLVAALGHDRSAVALGVAAGVVLAFGLGAPSLAARFDAVLGRVASLAARLVAAALAAVAQACVILPLWLVDRLSGFSPLASGRAREGSAFVPMATPAAASGREDSRASRLSGRDSRAPSVAVPEARLRRVSVLLMVGMSAVLVALVWPSPGRDAAPAAQNAGTRAQPVVPEATIDPSGFTASGGTTDGVSLDGVAVTRYAHEEEPWAPVHIREVNALRYEFDLFLGVRPRDSSGRTLNVRDGLRVSYTPADPTLTVWFFGGSTMFGVGQRDEHTIPSEVARLAEADGIAIRALNFGVVGDVNWLETQRFAQALTSKRRPPPDLVVFYDGVNDARLADRRVAEGATDPELFDRLPVTDDRGERPLEVTHQDGATPKSITGPHAATAHRRAVELAAVAYRRGVRTAHDLVATSRVPVVHVWQPSLLPGHGQIPRHSGVEPVDLTDVFDQVSGPIYFDTDHTNELGARLVAAALYPLLRPLLLAAPAWR